MKELVHSKYMLGWNFQILDKNNVRNVFQQRCHEFYLNMINGPGGDGEHDLLPKAIDNKSVDSSEEEKEALNTASQPQNNKSRVQSIIFQFKANEEKDNNSLKERTLSSR